MAETPAHATTEVGASPSRRVRRVGRWVALALLASFIALLAYGLTTTSTDDRIDQRLAGGRPAAAPAFSLPVLERGTLPPALEGALGSSLADGRLGLAELRGTPFVLNIWASWCNPCREEAPRLERGWRTWGRRGVAFIGLDIQDLTGDARAFLREFGISYPSIREESRKTANRYGATGIPETYFVDARGRVVGHVIGVVSDRRLAAGAAAARSGRVAGVSGGGNFRTTRRENRGS